MKVKNIMFSGFMAVILMGVAGNASAAVQIASKAYVDGRVDIDETTTVATELGKKADKSYVGTLPAGINSTDIVGYIQEKTAGIATEGAMTELSNRVTTAEGDIDALESAMTGDGEGSVAAKISAAVSTAKGELTTEINKKADSTTVDGISGRVQTLENAGYQNANQVSGAITTAITDLNLANTYEAKGEAAKVQGNLDTLSGTVDGIGGRVTTAEGEIDTLQSEMDAVEAKAAANEAAIGVNTTAIAGKVAQTAYDTKMSELDAAIAKKFALPEGCTGEGANCVLSSIGGNIQWVDITAPLQ